jgi:hypothetical protein
MTMLTRRCPSRRADPAARPPDDRKFGGNLALVIGSSLPAVLRERASLQPDDVALTFVDYDQDWAGVPESLTWSQLYKRASSVAQELSRWGSAGDRALILAPQGLDYIVAFLGALQARRIAVPLAGAADDRAGLVLGDTSPAAILTTSSAAATVTTHLGLSAESAGPAVIKIDSLEIEPRRGSATPDPDDIDSRSTAYLQYTSGSTRQPAGVMISHRNLLANFQQITADYFLDYGKVAPPRTTTVSWLPFYHDLGLILGICAPILAGVRGVSISPVAFLQRPGLLFGAEFRIRLGRPKNLRRRHGRAWPGRSADPAERRRAGAAIDPAAFHRAIRSFRLARQRDPTLVRTGRSYRVRGDPHACPTTENRPLRP